ncbi:hypothetical protein SAMN06265349_1011063 [Flavobacterium resistens]|uniref:Uncharacterized protein n=1 Tax=Flavobacterium resistens TaxID=443612 RepID=A0A521BHN0_9FLAO|nr:hypothetical protein [Flavobacterium resistens]MRX67379.1 hypothetical protein [Flavobacterium resistens]SMO46583.1 hypothetical protein SAMN06265349_1011063 [Flavobacterium resistens]
MLESQKEFIFKNKHLIDNKELLNYYLARTKSIKNSFKNLNRNTKDCKKYIEQIVEATTNMLAQKNEEFKQNTGKNLNKKMVESQNLIDNVDETVAILKPLYADIKNLKKQLWHLNRSVFYYKIKNIVINIIFILLLTFIFNFLIDIFQSFAENSFGIKHFILLVFAFGLQTFFIDPLVINKLRQKLNWALITEIEEKLPEIESKLIIKKNNFNSQVTKYEQLYKFKID